MEISIITATHNRPDLLRTISLPSVLSQSDPDFEWVIVNDGQNATTRRLITELNPPCRLTYLEMPHQQLGFGLCHARNLGLNAASGEWVAYLDDDNEIAPQFIEQTKHFLADKPSRCSTPLQWRRRDVIRSNRLVRAGQPFVSPSLPCSAKSLITQQSLFDSNGFIHYRADAPHWNSDYKVFADYEFLLSCLIQWGRNSFRLHPVRLVNYVQRSDGVIGQSSYGEWAKELEAIIIQHQGCLEFDEVAALKRLVAKWQNWQQQGKKVPPLNFWLIKQVAVRTRIAAIAH